MNSAEGFALSALHFSYVTLWLTIWAQMSFNSLIVNVVCTCLRLFCLVVSMQGCEGSREGFFGHHCDNPNGELCQDIIISIYTPVISITLLESSWFYTKT